MYLTFGALTSPIHISDSIDQAQNLGMDLRVSFAILLNFYLAASAWVDPNKTSKISKNVD